MKTLKLILILTVSLLGSGALLAASGVIWLPQTADNFGFGAGLFLLGWFVLTVAGFWALRFKALLNGTVMAVALSFAMYQGLKWVGESFLVEFGYLDRWAALLLAAVTSLLFTKLIAPAPVRRAIIGGPEEVKKSVVDELDVGQPGTLWRFSSKGAFYGQHAALWAYAVAWIGAHWVVWFWLSPPLLIIAILAEFALVLFMPNWPLLIRGYDWQTRKFEAGKVYRLRPIL